MSKMERVVGVAGVVLVSFLGSVALAGERGADGKAGDTPAAKASEPTAEQKAMMEAWMKAATAGEHHKKLDSMVGTWDATTTSWEAPGAPPQVNKGTSENTWVLGGRFVRQAFKGEYAGQPFEGIGYTGYDNLKKRYVGTWMDNMGTAVMVSTSTGAQWTKDGGLEFTTTMDDVVTGKPTKMRSIVKVIDDTKHIYQMFAPGPDGKEFKMMEIVYTRK